jgi:hypothetical protein
MAVWYCEADWTSQLFGWSLLTARANSTAYSVGDIRKQDGTISIGNERAYMCVVAGTSGSTSPTWAYTKGYNIGDGGVTWKEITGQPAFNGDATNTPVWAAYSSYGTTFGCVKNSAGTHYFTPTTGGNSGGTEPTWNTTKGVTTTDNTVTWVCIGPVTDYTAYMAPFSRIAAPINGTSYMAAGDTLYVSDRHNENQTASLSLVISNGTSASPLKILCVDHTTVPPTALATTATITVNSSYSLIFSAYAEVYGLVITAGTDTNSGVANSTNTNMVLRNCTFKNQAGTGFLFGSAYSADTLAKLTLIDCTLYYGSSTSFFKFNAGSFIVKNLSLSGSVPTTLFQIYQQCRVDFIDCDFNVAATNLVSISNTGSTRINFINCKLSASTTTMGFGSWPSSSPNEGIFLYNCDSGSTNYKYRTENYQGVIQHELTTIRTGGASDGVTPISWKAVSASGASFPLPLELERIAQWNESTGSPLTATVEIAGAASLTDGDIWLEIEYLGDASSCKGSIVSSRRGLLATAAAVTSSSAAWGGSPAYTQKLQCTFTPQKKGVVTARLFLAKSSTTVYIDPVITIA